MSRPTLTVRMEEAEERLAVIEDRLGLNEEMAAPTKFRLVGSHALQPDSDHASGE